MGDLGQGLDHRLFGEALDEQAPVFEDPVDHHRFVERVTGDPATGRPDSIVYTTERRAASVAQPSQADLQHYGGLYQQGDVQIVSRWEIRGPRDVDGQDGDQFTYAGYRWRIVGIVFPGSFGDRTMTYKALLRRI